MAKPQISKPPLENKTIFISGSARRIGKEVALACATAGASIVIHHGNSDDEAEDTAQQIMNLGREAMIIKANFAQPDAAIDIISDQLTDIDNLFGLINNASLFEPINFSQTNYLQWQTHMDINLTMPFLLSQFFVKKLAGRNGRIINMLDWRALRPGRDHFPYTITKSALASMTKALALALSPTICVNGLALGAILPPADGGDSEKIIQPVPMGRWAQMREVTDTILFLLTGPEYITGEIIHLDGGRNLV